MKQFILFTTFSFVFGFASAQSINSMDQFFTKADAFFGKYVEGGGVAYSAIKANKADLAALTSYLKTADLSAADNARKKAFWINAYNITTIKSVVDQYPLASPLDDKDFFTVRKHQVAGSSITLSDIEKVKLIGVDGDERLHFVLVCAANGCPKLASFAYTPDKLESQIASQTKKAMNDSYFVRVKTSSVEVSEIFSWYAGDFKKTGKGTIAYINQYRESKIPADFTVKNYTYDWKLNEKKN